VRVGVRLGVLWVSVDQAEELRKTHGVAACNAMLEKIATPWRKACVQPRKWVAGAMMIS
jgi:hypothetical protein